MGLYDFLTNTPPEKILDKNEFEPIKGAYNARIDTLEHITGVIEKGEKAGQPYDFYALRLQVKETVEGDKGDNRYLKKTYQNDEKGIKKLRDDMFTAGISDLLVFKVKEGKDALDTDALDATISLVTDKMVKVRAWHWKPKDREDRLQTVKIVAEFELKGAKGTDKSTTATPF